MANGFSESAEGLRYAEHISVPLRLFSGVLGFCMFLIPVPFVLHASLQTPWWHLLLAAACVLAATAMGLLCWVLAFGRVLSLQFNTTKRRVLRTSRWPLGARNTPLEFECFAPPDILERASEDGPYYVVRLTARGERPMHLASFDLKDDAEHWRSRIAAQLKSNTL